MPENAYEMYCKIRVILMILGAVLIFMSSLEICMKKSKAKISCLNWLLLGGAFLCASLGLYDGMPDHGCVNKEKVYTLEEDPRLVDKNGDRVYYYKCAVCNKKQYKHWHSQ
jgi:hypothetical protein